MQYIVSFIPVLLFLGMLMFMDSFRLIRKWLLVICLLWGVVSGCMCLFIDTWIAHGMHFSFNTLSLFIAPFIEEILKFSLLLFLILRNRIGFMIDAAIYGFAIGTGFSILENGYYLFQAGMDQNNLLIWIVRGFGTAVMHGGTTAIAGIILVNAHASRKSLIQAVIMTIVTTYLLHGAYNAFFISPLLSSLVIIILIPLVMILVFRRNERTLRKWLDLGLDEEIGLMMMIEKGKFSGTRAGKYLLSIKDHFPREVVLDMYCYTSLFLELSVKAKSCLLLKEYDFPLPADLEIPAKLKELNHLRRNIGKSGMLALHPILRMTLKDLWAISVLKPT